MAGTATRRGTKAADPVVEETDEDEFEELEDEESGDDLEELEEDEVEEQPAPKGKKTTTTKKTPTTTKKVEVPKFGSAQLAAHVTEVTGETYDARGIRMLLRKLAADGTLARVVGETRDRYSFSGPDDPIVVAVVQMVQDGTAKALKQAGLEKVKQAAAEKKAAAKKAKEPETESDEDEMEEVEEAPKPRTRRAAAKPPAPAKATAAKATPARRRASATA